MSQGSYADKDLPTEVAFTVNGDRHRWASGLTILSLLERLELAPETVAVEWNRKIVRRAEFDDLLLSPNDRLEIVRFVQGG